MGDDTTNGQQTIDEGNEDYIWTDADKLEMCVVDAGYILEQTELLDDPETAQAAAARIKLVALGIKRAIAHEEPDPETVESIFNTLGLPWPPDPNTYITCNNCRPPNPAYPDCRYTCT